MKEIPTELILNWDQTGVKIVPSSTWTMEAVGVNDKRLITGVFLLLTGGGFLACPNHLQRQDTTMSSSLPVSIRLGHHPLSQAPV